VVRVPDVEETDKRLDDERSHLLRADEARVGCRGKVRRPVALREHELDRALDVVRRKSIAAEAIAPRGFATPLPAMVGAEPWMGS
jgi:hypothetical protein